MNIEKLVKIYNHINDKRVYAKSESVIAKFQACSNYDDDIIEEVIRKNPTSEIWSIINPVFIKQFVENKKLTKKLEQDDASHMSLGLLEKHWLE